MLSTRNTQEFGKMLMHAPDADLTAAYEAQAKRETNKLAPNDLDALVQALKDPDAYREKFHLVPTLKHTDTTMPDREFGLRDRDIDNLGIKHPSVTETVVVARRPRDYYAEATGWKGAQAS